MAVREAGRRGFRCRSVIDASEVAAIVGLLELVGSSDVVDHVVD